MTTNEGTKYEQFDDLIGRYRKLIRKLYWRHSSGSGRQCDELVQDCYISIWCHLPFLRSEVHRLQQTAWVVWQCRSVFSHRRRSKPPDWLPLDDLLSDTLTADAEFHASEVHWTSDPTGNKEMIEEYAADLPPKERRLLALMMEGYGQKEIAKEMGISIETAKKMRQRLVKKLKKNNHDE